MPTGAPAYAPASKTTRPCSAVRVPSRRAPVFSSNTAAGAGVVARNSSRRVMTTETGRRSCRASAAARGSSRTNFAAECATERRGDDFHLVLGQAQHLADLRAREEQPLGARPDRQGAERIDGGQGRTGFEIALVHHGRRVAPLDDHVGLGEPSGDIAAVEVLRADHVGPHVFLQPRAPGGGAMHGQLFLAARAGRRAHAWRILAHGLDRVDGGGQDVVLDLHQRGGVLRDGRRLGGHGHHGMPREQRAIDGERRLAARRGIDLDELQITRGEDTEDARHLRRGLGVDPRDARVGVRAQDQTHVHHAGQGEVRGVAREAGHLLAAVHAAQRLSDC